MRNETTDDLGEQVTDLFNEFDGDVDSFIDMMEKKQCIPVFDIKHTHPIPSMQHEHGTVAYAYFHTIFKGGVLSVYTFPGTTSKWYCKY